MGYTATFFAVPATVPIEDVLVRFGELSHELKRENDYEGVYLATHEEERVRATGLRAFTLLVAPWREGWGVGPGFVTDRWQGSPLYRILYDDRRGRYAWEHFPTRGPPQLIWSDGPRVHASNIEISVEYSQRSLTTEELDTIFKKDEGAMSAAERHVLEGRKDAIEIGLEQFGFRARPSDFVDLVYAEEAWSLLDEPFTRKRLPDGVGPGVLAEL